jgi:hypothetical protein
MICMNIEIGNKYKLTSDKYNVVVNEQYEKQKDGEPSGEFDYKLSASPFHPDLERACLAILKMDILDSDAENLGELVQVIHSAKRDIILAAAKMTEALKGEVLES